MPKYLVTWEIDIEDDSPVEAARQAKEIQQDKDSEALFFSVKNQETGEITAVDLLEEDSKPTPEELEQFYKDWGQSHEEICCNLEYDEDTADDVLVDDYFWVEEKQLWCNKWATGMTERDEEIAEYLRFK